MLRSEVKAFHSEVDEYYEKLEQYVEQLPEPNREWARLMGNRLEQRPVFRTLSGEDLSFFRNCGIRSTNTAIQLAFLRALDVGRGFYSMTSVFKHSEPALRSGPLVATCLHDLGLLDEVDKLELLVGRSFKPSLSFTDKISYKGNTIYNFNNMFDVIHYGTAVQCLREVSSWIYTDTSQEELIYPYFRKSVAIWYRR